MKPKNSIAWRTDFYSFDMGEEKEDEIGYKFRETEFYDDQKISKQVEYNKRGEITLEIYNKFDDKGRLIESIEKNHDDEVEEKTVMEYDSEGHLLIESQYYNDELFEKTLNTYNTDGLLVEFVTYDSDDEAVIKQTMEYNAQRQNTVIRNYENDELTWEIDRVFGEGPNLTEEIAIEIPENKKQKTVYTYNEQGKTLNLYTFDEKGVLIQATENEYDERGNLLHQVQKDVKLNPNHNYDSWSLYGGIDDFLLGNRTVLSNVYDDNNRLIVKELFDVPANYLQSQEIITYDEEGNISEHEIYNHNALHGMQKTHYRLRIEWE